MPGDNRAGRQSCRATIVSLAALAYVVHMTAPDPVLEKFRAAITALYGPRIERIVLYGSRARDDARPDSDYDIAVFLKDLAANRWQDFQQIADIELAILDETGAVVHAMPFPAGFWQNRSSPLMYQLRADGRDV